MFFTTIILVKNTNVRYHSRIKLYAPNQEKELDRPNSKEINKLKTCNQRN